MGPKRQVVLHNDTKEQRERVREYRPRGNKNSRGRSNGWMAHALITKKGRQQRKGGEWVGE
jgi:hypothetical protein